MPVVPFECVLTKVCWNLPFKFGIQVYVIWVSCILKENSHCMFDFDDSMWFASGK